MSSTEQKEIARLGRRFKAIFSESGISGILSRGLDKVTVYSLYKAKKNHLQNKTFSIFGHTHKLFIHHYNATWRNERAIEIAIANFYMDRWKCSNLLEMGNVMSYYRQHTHVVVDKYERSPGIINQDFVNLDTLKQYDGVISISTFEHVGWDEAVKSKEKLIRCFQMLGSLSNNKEKILVTVPLGYNKFLDELAADNELPFDRVECLIRKSTDQTWKTATIEEALHPDFSYKKKYDGANSLLVGLGLKQNEAE